MNVYDSIMQGLTEAVAYTKGELSARTSTIYIAPLPNINSVDVRKLRAELSMTQMVFARVMGVSVKTVEAWENGRNKPNGPATRLMCLLKDDPQLLERYKVYNRYM